MGAVRFVGVLSFGSDRFPIRGFPADYLGLPEPARVSGWGS